MDTQAITLSTGHVVTLKKALTYRARRAITAALMGDQPLKITPGNKDSLKERVMEVRYQNVEAYQDETLRALVVSVKNPDGTDASDPFEAIMELPEEAAQEVIDATTTLTDAKKK